MTPDKDKFEQVSCPCCTGAETNHFCNAEEDLTGKPGTFTFVTCEQCGLVYQNPRLALEHIGEYYDKEYIAHRKKKDWGVMTPFYEYAMDKHDRKKNELVSRYTQLNRDSRVLDIGCAAATFLHKMRKVYGAHCSGVDFVDLSSREGFEEIDFHCGLFYEQDLPADSFDLITMWHFLEHDYDQQRSLQEAARVMRDDGRLIIEVPRLDSLTYRLYQERWPGLQAPQHTVLYSKEMLLKTVTQAGFSVVDYLPYGSFPPYFYLFCGLAFKFLKGRGLNLDKAIVPYFLGQLLCTPILLFEKKLNLAMQTVVCAKRA
ncbi:MAG: class I SAM-dependent methyltransferase [Candidatus Electrothrix sp. AR4]|nr:class I SAM-dependent methyltransferase [Candidatus Electrothrix sp. AR4]